MSVSDKVPQASDRPDRMQRFRSREAWHVMKIMAEFVESTEELSDIGPAVTLSCAEMALSGTTTFCDQYFFAEEIGPYFYNRGLYDAQAILESRLENIAEAIYEIEKPTQFVR